MAWKHLILFFTKKVNKLQRLKISVRGICLQSVMAKWYIGTLMALVKRHRRVHMHEMNRQLMVVGFEEKRKIEDVTESHRALGKSGSEWGRELGLYIFQGDVEDVFDNWHPVEALEGHVGGWDKGGKAKCKGLRRGRGQVPHGDEAHLHRTPHWARQADGTLLPPEAAAEGGRPASSQRASGRRQTPGQLVDALHELSDLGQERIGQFVNQLGGDDSMPTTDFDVLTARLVAEVVRK